VCFLPHFHLTLSVYAPSARLGLHLIFRLRFLCHVVVCVLVRGGTRPLNWQTKEICPVPVQDEMMMKSVKCSENAVYVELILVIVAIVLSL
jgi:hypothetical protein